MASAEPAPIGDAEAVALFATLKGRRGIGLAVSGGADSTALLHLHHRARALDGDSPRAVVLTVDHGLRPEAGAEARAVGELAGRLGYSHRILEWRGDKPTSNLQAAARDARRALLLGAVADLGLDTLALAHHADDQAETVVMRLARGSGVAGLAAMARERVESGVLVARPLLDVPRARLVATLTAAGQGWFEDPSNGDARFERARVRAAAAGLADLGLTRERLTATARTMARAAAALDVMLAELVGAAVTIHPGGWARIEAAPWARAPEEIRLRLISRLIAAVTGAVHAPRLEACERLDRAAGAAWASGERWAETAAGALIEVRRGAITIAPEIGRGERRVRLAPGEAARWFGRRIGLRVTADGPVEIGHLGLDGRARLAAEGRLGEVGGASAAIVATAAAVRVEGAIVAVPGLTEADGGVEIAPPAFAGASSGGVR
ncbi:MAG: tRNA lysidine(34) synthetase TilS [Siculibacillus sp.]